MKRVTGGVRKVLLLLISLYQNLLSPYWGGHCRFHPTCSEYARLALTTHGIMRGLFYTVRRLLRCHPWHCGGFDPIPPST